MIVQKATQSNIHFIACSRAIVNTIQYIGYGARVAVIHVEHKPTLNTLWENTIYIEPMLGERLFNMNLCIVLAGYIAVLTGHIAVLTCNWSVNFTLTDHLSPWLTHPATTTMSPPLNADQSLAQCGANVDFVRLTLSQSWTEALR